MIVFNVDFTGVEVGGRWLSEGTYVAEVVSIECKPGKQDDFLVWTFASIEPETAGARGTLMTSLAEKALWKLKETLIGLGAKAEGPMRIETEKFIGRKGKIVVVNEPYTGSDGIERASHKIARLLPREAAQEPSGVLAPNSTPESQPSPPDDFAALDFIGDDDIPF